MMSKWHIREAVPEDLDALIELWRVCFQTDSESFVDWYFTAYYNYQETIVACTEDGKVIGSAQLISQTIVKGNNGVPAAYVVGVNCFPEYRGHGVVGALMQWIYSESEEDLLLLMPFEASFYSKQFTFFDWHGHLQLPFSELAHLAKKGSLTIERMRLSVGMALALNLNTCYEVWQKRYFSYYSKRDNRRWMSIIDDLALENGDVALFRDKQGIIMGYILYRIVDDSFFVREVAYANAFVREQIYYYIYEHRSQCHFLDWSAPFEEALVRFRSADKENAALYPFMMIRLQNPTIIWRFADILPMRPYVFEVHDHERETRTQYFWDRNSENIIALHTLSQAPQFILSLQSFNKVVFTDVPHADIFDEPDTVINDLDAFYSFAAMFHSKRTYFNEYF